MHISYFNRAPADHKFGSFFVGWGIQPSLLVFRTLLASSDKVTIAVDDETQTIIGFATAITDGILSSYISFVEVDEGYQRHGVGTELITRLKAQLGEIYMIDLVCDERLIEYYRRLGFSPTQGMSIRNYSSQGGRNFLG